MTKNIQGIITAVTQPKEFEGSLQIGFVVEKHWYNISGEETDLKNLLKAIIIKGNEVKFDLTDNKVSNLILLKTVKVEDKKFDDDTNFESLLDSAHRKFGDKLNIKTELISVDYEKKQAIFSASVSIEYSENNIRVFTSHGDAEGIKSDLIKPHFIRMAETRAIARALRWATNNAKTAEEEK